MKNYLLISFLLINICSYSQIIFEKGYFIDDFGQKTECLIKNLDWQKSPTEFEYKINKSSEIEKASIKTVSEFGVYENSKYVRASVELNKSIQNTENLKGSIEKNSLETVFLKTLLEGDASLYEYEKGSLKYYFYKINDSEIKILSPKQQLWQDLKCSDIDKEDIKKLDFTKKKLVHLFEKYNLCKGKDYKVIGKGKKTDLFNLNIRPGVSFSNLSIENHNNNIDNTKFDQKVTFRFGIEAEFILAFNKNKWSIFLEPTYQYFKSNSHLFGNTKTLTYDYDVSLDYKSLEIPIGVRHYFFLNQNSKLFLNLAAVFEINNKPEIEFEHKGIGLALKSRFNLALGAGYKLNDKYNVELRYYSNRDIIEPYADWKTDFGSFSIIFGYTLF